MWKEGGCLHYLVANLIFVASLVYFTGIFLKQKSWMAIGGLGVFLVGMFWFFNGLAASSWEVYRNYMMGSFVLVAVFYEGGFRKKAQVFLSFVFLFLLVEFVSDLMLHPFSSHDDHHMIQGSILSKAALLIGIKSIHLLYRSRQNVVPRAYTGIVGAITVIELYLLSVTLVRDYRMEVMSYRVLAMFLIFDVLLLYLLDRLQDSYRLKTTNFALSYQIRAYHEHQVQYENYLSEIRGFRHDFNNHLMMLREFGVQEGAQQVVNYINQLDLSDRADSDSLIAATGNLAIDSLVNYKYLLMKKYGIPLEIEIFVPVLMDFGEVDLTILIGNLLDNAIAGARTIPLDQRFINVKIHFKQQNLLVTVENSFDGILYSSEEGALRTTKEDPDYHGLGLGLVRSIVKKYHGLFEIETTPDVFMVKALLYSELRSER